MRTGKTEHSYRMAETDTPHGIRGPSPKLSPASVGLFLLPGAWDTIFMENADRAKVFLCPLRIGASVRARFLHKKRDLCYTLAW